MDNEQQSTHNQLKVSVSRVTSKSTKCIRNEKYNARYFAKKTSMDLSKNKDSYDFLIATYSYLLKPHSNIVQNK